MTKVSLHQYKNIFVTRSGIGMKWFRLIPETIHQYRGKRKHFLKYAILQFFLRRRIKLSGNYFIIHNHWCPGYYHWITEALPRLFAAKGSIDGYKLILPESFRGTPYESLKPLYDGEIIWVPQNRNVIVENLLVPANPVFSGCYDKNVFQNLRRLYIDYFTKDGSTPNIKIYVSRAKANRRSVINENEILPIVVRNGYEVVFFEDLSFEEQVLLMSKTKSLISIHGAGLTNMLFMPKGGLVIELQKEVERNETQSMLYKDFSDILDLQYHILFCKGTGGDIYNSGIYVDVKSFEKLVESI